MVHLVLLPGMDGGSDLSRSFRELLPRTMTSEVIDYPPSQKLGYDALVDRVQARLSEISGPVVLLGESFSGPIAVRVAAAPPVNLAAVVLVATFAIPPVPGTLRFLARSTFFRLPPPRPVLRRYLAGPGASDALVDQVTMAIKDVRPEVLAHRLREILSVDVREELERISIPILCIEGAHDRLVVRRRALAACRPDLERKTLEAPHLVLQARPDLAAKVVADFI